MELTTAQHQILTQAISRYVADGLDLTDLVMANAADKKVMLNPYVVQIKDELATTLAMADARAAALKASLLDQQVAANTLP